MHVKDNLDNHNPDHNWLLTFPILKAGGAGDTTRSSSDDDSDVEAKVIFEQVIISVININWRLVVAKLKIALQLTYLLRLYKIPTCRYVK